MSYQTVLHSFTSPVVLRQPYLNLQSVPYNMADHVRIMYRNYLPVPLYPKPRIFYPVDDINYPESVESESVGSSSGYDLQKPEEYRITGDCNFLRFFIKHS